MGKLSGWIVVGACVLIGVPAIMSIGVALLLVAAGVAALLIRNRAAVGWAPISAIGVGLGSCVLVVLNLDSPGFPRGWVLLAGVSIALLGVLFTYLLRDHLEIRSRRVVRSR